MKPNLFIVGAAKCGTTSLHSYLRSHPDIFMSAPKEPHYFCTDFHRSSDALKGTQSNFGVRSQEDYLALFDQSNEKKIVGEASASYLHSKEAAKNIFEFNPGAKIVICLRSPAELVRSWHSYLLFCLEENLELLDDALEAEEGRKSSVLLQQKLPSNLRYPERLYYSSIASLADQIERYFDFFPLEQVFFIVLDDIREQPQQIYSRLLDFLEVSPHVLEQFEVQNARSTRRSPVITYLQREWLTPLAESAKPQILSRILPQPLKRFGYKALSKISLGLDKVNRIDSASYDTTAADELTMAQLRDNLRPEVKKLSKIIHRTDLIDRWG